MPGGVRGGLDGSTGCLCLSISAREWGHPRWGSLPGYGHTPTRSPAGCPGHPFPPRALPPAQPHHADGTAWAPSPGHRSILDGNSIGELGHSFPGSGASLPEHLCVGTGTSSLWD